jgi:N-acetyltransferase 10
VFLSSTINGYEGTGRSLSLKLLNKLREQNKFNTGETNINISGDRILKEIELIEPIRYSNNDPIE